MKAFYRLYIEYPKDMVTNANEGDVGALIALAIWFGMFVLLPAGIVGTIIQAFRAA